MDFTSLFYMLQSVFLSDYTIFLRNLNYVNWKKLIIFYLLCRVQIMVDTTRCQVHLEFDKIISLSTLQIEKLKEYRQSIISEAVTGKVDVREWQPNKQQVA